MERIRIAVGDLVFDARAAGPADGPLVLLLHGFPQTSYEWRHQIPGLASLGFRVVAPDQRGYSPDARPAGIAAYAMPALVGDVVGIADRLGRRTFHVVGHDWGAAVAWFTALAHPDRVPSLVAISVPHPAAFRRALQSPSGEQERMSAYMEMFRADSAEALFLADDAAFLRRIYADAGLPPADVEEYASALGTPEAIGAALNWYRAMEPGAAPPPAPPIAPATPTRMPVTFVWSTGDAYLGREGAELTAEYVEGPYRFEVLEGVSHWVPEEAPERMSAILEQHFTPYRPSAPGGAG